jgi:hypothetical protein
MKRAILLFSALLLVAFPLCLPAQETASSSAASEAERKLDEQIRIREKEKKLAQLDKDILDAQPKAKATPLSGELTQSGESIEPDIMVYQALGRLAGRVSGEIGRTVPQNATILIFDEDDAADIDFYRKSYPYVKLSIEDMIAGFSRFHKKDFRLESTDRQPILPSGTVLPNITNLVGQAVDLLSYFRTQTTEKNVNVKIGEEALVAQMFNSLSERRDLVLYYPKKFAPDTFITCANLPDCSDLLGLMDRLYAARRLAKVDEKTDADLRLLDKSFNDFIQKLTEKEKDTPKRSPLERLVTAEKMIKLIDRTDAYFLSLRSINAVGKQRVRKNLFFFSDKADYNGGIVLEWMLYDETGRVRSSGVYTEYLGYKSPKGIKSDTVLEPK